MCFRILRYWTWSCFIVFFIVIVHHLIFMIFHPWIIIYLFLLYRLFLYLFFLFLILHILLWLFLLLDIIWFLFINLLLFNCLLLFFSKRLRSLLRNFLWFIKFWWGIFLKFTSASTSFSSMFSLYSLNWQ